MLRLATCQIPTSADASANAAHMEALIASLAGRADLAHFGEGALSGYAPHDLPDYDGYDLDALRSATARVVAAARAAGLWVVFGSIHPLSGPRPHNSVYVVDPDGRLVDRYDKRFCAGPADGQGELALYAPGDHATVFDVAGVRIGVLICHEIRYPELRRDYVRRGVQLVLHSFHAAHMNPTDYEAMEAAVGAAHHAWNPATTIAGITQIAGVHVAASDNHLWVSAANSCAPRACWSSFVVRPDGVAVGRLPKETPGSLITVVDPSLPLYDSTRAWRRRAMEGVLHSGTLIDDPRSRDRTRF